MAGTPIDFIRFAADQALAVPAQINLRPYTITLNTLSWSGDRPGIGTLSTISQILFNDGYTAPRVRQVNKEDIVLSGGQLRDQDLIIGPFTFPYDDNGGNTGGYDPLIFSPATITSDEFYINVQGPNIPTGGLNFKKLYDDSAKANVMYRVYIRNVAAVLP